MIAERRPTPGPVHVPIPLPVIRTVRETADTRTIVLDASGLPGGLRFEPGQFCMLYAFGVGEIPLSLSGDPGLPERPAHTVRAVGAVSRAIAAARRGTTLGVRGPFGSGWPLGRAVGADLLLVAGGLGLAPLRPVVYHVVRHRRDYGRVALVFGARTPDDIPFGRELSAWRGRFDLQVEVTVDRAGPSWRGHVGVAPALLPRAEVELASAVALVCGPEVMMRFTVRELLDRGLSAERIFLSLERNMKCAVGSCGHCQLLPYFVCKDGPVFRFDAVASLLSVREL